MMFVMRRLFVERGVPISKDGKEFSRIPATEFASRAVAGAVFGEG